jgi:hypothetical protein
MTANRGHVRRHPAPRGGDRATLTSECGAPTPIPRVKGGENPAIGWPAADSAGG